MLPGMPDLTAADAPVLSQRDLNRALLARQGLLERHGGRVPAVLDKIGGIQAQYAPAMYVGLWSRMRGVDRAAVTGALERRTAIQGTLMRSTIHLVSRADYWPTTLAIRPHRREWHLRALKNNPPEAAWLAAADRLRTALADGPLHRKQVDQVVGLAHRAGINLWLDLVRVPPSGTWEHRPADLFDLADRWVGPEAGTAADGVELLVRRYLGGFGPAQPADIANWAQLPVASVTSALGAMPTRTFRDERGKRLFDLPRAPLPGGVTEAPVRFLPTWDATLLVHARRTLILPEEHRSKIFSTKNPHSVNTFLVDGQVAGTWRYEIGKITTEPFEPLGPAVRRAVSAEAEELAELYA